MKNLAPGVIATFLLLATQTVSAQQPVDDYFFAFPKIKYAPLQPPPAGMTYYITTTEKTPRLSEENLRELKPLIDITLKYNRKTPDVNFHYDITGITITNQDIVSEKGKYFRIISYTIKSSILCKKGREGEIFNTLVMEDGTKVKSIKVGGNFFRQKTLDNDMYPKPAEIPNMDAPGYVPSLEESLGRIPPIGFSTVKEVEEFEKKYSNFILAKAEALAVETEFKANTALLEVLFGNINYREDFAVATVKFKKDPALYSDFDKAQELIKNAFKIFSVNVSDTAAYFPMLREAVSTYTAIEKANEERVKHEIVQSVIHHNLALANAWLLNIDEANEYVAKLRANRRAAPNPADILLRVIEFQTKRAVIKKGFNQNVLQNVAKS
jgi:hypothetical protein